MSTNRRLAPGPAALVALGLVVAACGTDAPGSPETAAADGTSPSASPSATASTSVPAEPDTAPADAPRCSEVWQVGAKIPRGYAGCLDEGTYVERDVLGCSSGQRLVRFDETFYGVLGGTVRRATVSPLADDADYRRSVRSCRA